MGIPRARDAHDFAPPTVHSGAVTVSLSHNPDCGGRRLSLYCCAMSRRTPPKKKGRRKSRRRTNASGFGRRLAGLLLKLSLVGLVALGGLVVYDDAVIRAQFEGKRWSLPAQVYARPMEIYTGRYLRPEELGRELDALGYRKRARPEGVGEYSVAGDRYEVLTRGFTFWDGREPSRRIRVGFDGGTVSSLRDAGTGGGLGVVRLEPQRIGGIYPAHAEDRVLVRLDEVPPELVQALIAVEDRAFYDHFGISLRGIARALWANIRAGGVVQGGSTLTQQLVKNFFLTSERSLWRKGQEAIMALLLEWHYTKEEILEAYLNEVYLGQDGTRSIHGFGLASHFYFARPLEELGSAEYALLAGLVRGPSYYNPRKHPERARLRRDSVIDQLVAEGGLSAEAGAQAKKRPLGVTPRPPGGSGTYPAFIDLVQRQLRRDYRDEDLTTEGLRIFTTLDPRVQHAAEQALAERLKSIERQRAMESGVLQGSLVVSTTEGGEVLAVVGGREARFAGFNRALDAVRPIGSLVKPAVYLAALAGNRYSLATPIDDQPLEVKSSGGQVWRPQNYDKQSHGEVPLYQALAHSYNLATARLGMQVGLPQVVEMLHRLGVDRNIPAYPSVLLGALELSPLEVTQVYETLAAGGFRTPLRAIREVLDADGQPLGRYPLAVEQAVQPAPAFLITAAMQEVMRSGTGRSAGARLGASIAPAGKTGTTDELRDSWFAGFTGDYLAVAWVGRDDNTSAGLTGATGAMQVWGDVMESLHPQPLRPVVPAGVSYRWVDGQGRLSGSDCPGAVELPFAEGTVPVEYSPCGGGPGGDLQESVDGMVDWFRELFR